MICKCSEYIKDNCPIQVSGKIPITDYITFNVDGVISAKPNDYHLCNGCWRCLDELYRNNKPISVTMQDMNFCNYANSQDVIKVDNGGGYNIISCPYYIQSNAFYWGYIKSKAWQLKRMERLDMDNYKCARCGSEINVNVHHLSYERLGHEDVSNDLITLCNKCHASVHNKYAC